MNGLAFDLRTALRSLRRSPTFTVTAVLLRPIPVLSPDRIVLPRALNREGSDVALTQGEVDQFRHASRTMQDIAGFEHFGAYQFPKLDGDRPLPLAGAGSSSSTSAAGCISVFARAHPARPGPAA